MSGSRSLAPERLAVDDEEGGAEYALRDRVLGSRTQGHPRLGAESIGSRSGG
jgi:hypothetical protein